MKALVSLVLLLASAVPAAWMTVTEVPIANTLEVVAPLHVGYAVPVEVQVPARGELDPYHMIANNKGTSNTYVLKRDINSPNLGWGSGRKAFTTFDLNKKTIFAQTYGLWLNDVAVPDTRDPTKNDLDIPDGAKFKNGTVVAPRLIKPGSERIVLENIAFITDQAAVAEDQKLPIKVTALSQSGQPSTVTNLQFRVTDPSMGTFEPRVATDPPGINGHFRPAKVGQATLEVTGTNRKNQPITGTLTIEVVGGAATVLRVESLAPVDQ